MLEIGVAAFSVCYAAYFIITFCTAQFSAMRHLKDVQGGLEFCKQMREAPPCLSFHVECYHYETYTTRDKNGRIHTHRRKVTTISRRIGIPIPYWCDATPPLFVPNYRLLIHIKTRFTIKWMHNSESVISSIRNRIYDDYRHRDTHCDVTRSEYIPGLIENIMILNGKAKKIPFLIKWPRIVLAFFGFGLHSAFHIATVASVEKFCVVKKASFEAPVVSHEFCQQHQIDFSTITAKAPVVTTNDFSQFQYNETDSPATVPCIVNPYPLTFDDPSQIPMYNDANYYDAIYQQQQQLIQNGINNAFQEVQPTVVVD